MPTDRSPIKILVADDHAIFREGLPKLLEGAEDVAIVGEASNGVECVKMLAKGCLSAQRGDSLVGFIMHQ